MQLLPCNYVYAFMHRGISTNPKAFLVLLSFNERPRPYHLIKYPQGKINMQFTIKQSLEYLELFQY